MRIRYETTMDDMVAFNLYCYRRLPVLRRQIATNTALTVIIGFILYMLLGFLILGPGSWIIALFISTVASVLMGAMYRLLLPRNVAKLVRKMYAAGDNKARFGPQELEILPDGLMNRAAFSESKFAWGAIESVETDEDRTYIFVGATSAHIVTHASISEGNLAQFLEEMRKYYRPEARLNAAPLEIPGADV